MSDPWDGLPPPSRLDAAVEAHRDRFGEAPGIFRLRGVMTRDELAAAIEAAVVVGAPLDVDALLRRKGVADLPPGALA